MYSGTMPVARQAERATYPRRPRFFALKFIRLLAREDGAKQLGPDVCWMLAVIVCQEDEARYRPVTFFNDQLLSLVGFARWERLAAARRRACEAGWLHYAPPPKGSRGRPGVYWVLEPTDSSNDADGVIDEGERLSRNAGDSQGDSRFRLSPENSDGQQDGKRDGQGDGEGEPSYPSPSPSPSPNPVPKRKRARIAFRPPTVDEVAAYCRERGNSVDAEQFVNYYSANGWRVGRNPMKDWQASVRTWEKNSVQNGASRNVRKQATGPSHRDPSEPEEF